MHETPWQHLICFRYELFEEAFEIYKKFGLKQQAIKVVLDHMEDLNRAHEFATKVTQAEYRASVNIFSSALVSFIYICLMHLFVETGVSKLKTYSKTLQEISHGITRKQTCTY